MRKTAAMMLVGGILSIGAVNALGEMITGTYLLDGGSASPESTNVASSTEDQGWTQPVDAPTGTAYRAVGAHWASGYHTGVDFVVPISTFVKSVSSGQVVAAGWTDSYGQQVVIKHGNDLYTQYAHLSKLSVSEGDSVDRGQQIGLSGDTGNSTGPHLHFEVRTGPKYGSDIDPVAALRERGVSL